MVDASKVVTSRRFAPPPMDDPLSGRFDDVPLTNGWDADAPKPKAEPLKITATPFVWRDPKTFPRRRWLYGFHLIRKFISCTVSPGGVGKSSLALVEAVAMATGRPLLGVQSPEGPLTVWVLNLEDPQEEIERRVTAILLHYKIDPSEIEGRLFLDSGRHLKLIVAETTRSGTVIARPLVDAFTAEIQARKVDVVVIDPFVKSHRVPENDNGAIDMVATVFADIADACNCAFDLIHHVRKTGGNEVTVEDGRGAVALLGAVRSARALNGMSKAEAEKVGKITNHREFFRVANGKLNMAPPPPDKAEWFRLVSVSLGNGDEPFGPNPIPFDNSDHVQCVTNWEWPAALDDVRLDDLKKVQVLVRGGEWRESVQCKNWVGIAVANVLGLDPTDKAARSKINSLLSIWYATKMLRKEDRFDKHREEKTFVIVGEAASD